MSDNAKHAKAKKKRPKVSTDTLTGGNASGRSATWLRRTKRDVQGPLQLSEVHVPPPITISAPPPVSNRPRPLLAGGTGGLIKLRNTGLATPERTAKFATEAMALKTRWATRSPDQRRQEMVDLANSALTESWTPPIAVSSMPTSDNPSFIRVGWVMNIPPEMTDDAADDRAFTTFAGSVYHEARHAEQVYLAARKMATEELMAHKLYRKPAAKLTATDMANWTKIRGDIARRLDVTPAVIGTALSNPLDPQDDKAWALADAWQASFERPAPNQAAPVDEAGTNAARLLDILNDDEVALGRYNRATLAERDAYRAEYTAKMWAQNKPANWNAYVNSLYPAYQASRAAYEGAYRMATRQPVENDAWAVGESVEQLLPGGPVTADQILAQRIGAGYAKPAVLPAVPDEPPPPTDVPPPVGPPPPTDVPPPPVVGPPPVIGPPPPTDVPPPPPPTDVPPPPQVVVPTHPQPPTI